MGVLSRLIRRSVHVAVLAAIVVGGTACTASVPTSSAAPTTGASTAPTTTRATAGESAAGLVALARLGTERGESQQVRDAAGILLTAAQGLATALAATETAPAPAIEAQVRDLAERAGPEFDPAWLRAAADALADTHIAAYEVLASPETPDTVKDAVRQAVGAFYDARTALAARGAAAGATTPTTVEAGDGGWVGLPSAWVTVAGIALVGLGGAMLGGALTRRRARR